MKSVAALTAEAPSSSTVAGAAAEEEAHHPEARSSSDPAGGPGGTAPAGGGDAAAAAEPQPEAGPTAGTVLWPGSRVDLPRARLKQLGEPIYGTKEVLWTRLSKAESALKARQDALREAAARHEAMAAGAPGVEPRVVPGPAAPSHHEGEKHMVTHTPPAPWC